MKRRSIRIVVLLFLLAQALVISSSASLKTAGAKGEDVRSWPPDLTNYSRPATPEDHNPNGKGAAPMNIGTFVRDVVVSNTNPNLQNTDTFGDTEPSIAVNPSNPNEIVLTAFSGGWGANSPVWHTTDGGNTWTKQFTVPAPPGLAQAGGCPCDQSIDFGRGNRMSGTFLLSIDIASGTTTNPASAAAWNWFTTGNPAVTQLTNQTAVGDGNADQPWLLVNRDPTTAAQDNVYVAYDNFGGGPDMRVAVAQGTNPPNFTIDNQSGTSGGGGINPGHRLTVDPNSGAVYSLFQVATGGGPGGSRNVNYMLNRSTDGGATWTLNGNAGGIAVANADSNQTSSPKFGTVNALLGGVDHAAVDPNFGYVYYAYGARDNGTGNNRIAVARLQNDGSGNLNVVSTGFASGQVQAALPSIAVTDDGTVGVLYDTFDGFSSVEDPNNPGNFFPIFSAHLAVSSDLGVTFIDRVLSTFLSPATDNGNNRQRVLGDYHVMKAVGNSFYGVFVGNGAVFGRSTSNTDPIFFKAIAGGPALQVSGDLDFGTVARGTSATREVTLQNGGTSPLIINGVSFDPGSSSDFSIVNNPGVPQTIQPGGSLIYTIRFAPPANSSGGTRTGTLRIESSDPTNPTVTLAAQGTVGVPIISVPSSLNFGSVAVDDRTIPNTSDQVLHITNQASCTGCNLTLLSLPISGPNASDFSIVSPPGLPATIPAGSTVDITVRFNPSNSGLRTATLTVNTDDPANPSRAVSLSGVGLLPAISASPGTLIFPPTVYSPVCSPICGRTAPVTISSNGPVELILDLFNFTGSTAFSGPGPTTPPTRVQPGSSFVEPVTFLPTGGPARALTGNLRIQDNIGGAGPVVGTDVALCGESVGRGIRVMVFDTNGNLVPIVKKLSLQSHGLTRPVNIQLKDQALTTIDPPISCQRIQYQYENQDLQATEVIGNRGSYYILTVSVGNRHATISFTLNVNEFKTLILTVQ